MLISKATIENLGNMLPKEAIIEFKKLYQKRYQISLSDEEASFRANNLVNLYTAVYGHPSVGKIENRNKENNN